MVYHMPTAESSCCWGTASRSNTLTENMWVQNICSVCVCVCVQKLQHLLWRSTAKNNVIPIDAADCWCMHLTAGPAHTHHIHTNHIQQSGLPVKHWQSQSFSGSLQHVCVCVCTMWARWLVVHAQTHKSLIVNITAEVKPHCMCVYSRFPIISEPAALMVKQRTTKNSKIWLQNEVAVPLLTCFKSSDSNDRHPWCKSSEYEVISCVVFSSSPPFTYLLTFIKWLKQNELRRRLQLPLTLRGHAAGYS